MAVYSCLFHTLNENFLTTNQILQAFCARYYNLPGRKDKDSDFRDCNPEYCTREPFFIELTVLHFIGNHLKIDRISDRSRSNKILNFGGIGLFFYHGR